LRVAALILGIIGGMVGLIAAGVALGVGALANATGAQGGNTVVYLGWAALALSGLGIVGGALALAKPRAASVLMLIAGIGGLVAISLAYVVSGPLLIVGGVLAFIGRGKTTHASVPFLATGAAPSSMPGEPPTTF
jgi:hypothetical protein